MNSLVWGGDLFRRIYLPRTVFAISAILTGVVNLFLSLVPLLVVMLIVGVKIRAPFVLVVIPILLVALFALGITLLLSSIGVFFPDVVEMYQIAIQAWFYVTPVLYKLDILPGFVRSLVRLNPMVYFVDIFRLPTFYGQVFSWKITGLSTLVALLTLVVGWVVFAQVSEELAYRA
jgi:ABC-type polysaccharide/polyol phosphate export permease